METNRFKRRLDAGHAGVIGGNYDTSDMIDFVGSLGVFDAVWVDMEHGPTDMGRLADLSRAADLWGMSTIVRVRDHDASLIARTLGEGADGVIVPHVSTRAQAEQVVQSAKFAPIGRRGVGGGRKSYGRPDYFTAVNDDTTIIVMIEDAEALENLAEIVTVAHIDVFFIARFDLAQSLGYLHDPLHPTVIAAVDEAIDLVVAAGRVAGSAASAPTVREHLERGVRCIKAPSWNNWVQAGARTFADATQFAGSPIPGRPGAAEGTGAYNA